MGALCFFLGFILGAGATLLILITQIYRKPLPAVIENKSKDSPITDEQAGKNAVGSESGTAQENKNNTSC